MPGCSLQVWAEAQQPHEKVQGPHNGSHKGKTIAQSHGRYITLEFQDKEAKEEVTTGLTDELAARFPDKLASEPMLQWAFIQEGAHCSHSTQEVALQGYP